MPGAEFGRIRPQGLDRIEDDEVRALALRDGRQNVLDIGFGGKLDRRVRRAEALRPEPDLRDGLFAGNIDDAVPSAGERRGSLHQKGRLADAGVAADQNRRTPHKAAAGRTVQLGNAGRNAGSVLDIARERSERDRAAFARAAQGRWPATDAAAGAFLDECVPFAASIAFPGPARMHRAAILTDELDAGFSH